MIALYFSSLIRSTGEASSVATCGIVQPSEVHTGLCEDPAACLDELFERLVR